jgi:hypothetical protein
MVKRLRQLIKDSISLGVRDLKAFSVKSLLSSQSKFMLSLAIVTGQTCKENFSCDDQNN